MSTLAATCSGTGTCPSQTMPCPGNYTCENATACRTTCTTDAHCVVGSCLPNGTCGAKFANGSMCMGNGQCVSGICTQGVCCNAACTESCKSCIVSGVVGTCTNVAAGGDDPKNMCASEPGCGQTGKCDGSGGCQKSTMSCGSACVGNSVQTQACNGAGVCAPSLTPPTTCGNQVCSGGACVACTTDGQCGGTRVCNLGTGLCEDAPVPDAAAD
jgi:hypothetical protein